MSSGQSASQVAKIPGISGWPRVDFEMFTNKDEVDKLAAQYKKSIDEIEQYENPIHGNKRREFLQPILDYVSDKGADEKTRQLRGLYFGIVQDPESPSYFWVNFSRFKEVMGKGVSKTGTRTALEKCFLTRLLAHPPSNKFRNLLGKYNLVISQWVLYNHASLDPEFMKCMDDYDRIVAALQKMNANQSSSSSSDSSSDSEAN